MEYYQAFQNRAVQTATVINQAMPALAIGGVTAGEFLKKSQALEYPVFPAFRPGHRLLQRPSNQKQITRNRCMYIRYLKSPYDKYIFYFFT